MLKIVLSAAVAALLALPLSIQAQEYSDPPAKSGTSTSKAKKSSGETKSETTTEKKKKEPTKGQLEARERQAKCGAEWREAKAKGTVEKGLTWPKFWSACNKRLKEKTA
jgi:hypothetical protein